MVQLLVVSWQYYNLFGKSWRCNRSRNKPKWWRTQKCWGRYTRLLCDNIPLNRIIIVSPENARHWFYSDNFILKCHWPYILRFNMVFNWYRWRSGIIPTHLIVASELELTVCCLLPAMYAIWGCDSVNSFSHTRKITTFEALKNKLEELTDTIDFGEFLSLSLESPSVVTSVQYVCMLFLWWESDSSVNELRYRMFTQKNLRGDGLPPTFDALVLNLRRALIFFHRYLFNIFSGPFFFIYQKSKKVSLYGLF